MDIIGIDLAKYKFHVCVMDKRGKVKKRFECNRNKLLPKVLNEGKAIIAMESCGSSNYWSRLFSSHGYEVKLISGQFVKPFVKSNKNDVADAEAICEAAQRPQMRFVSTRSEEQQDVQNVHRVRERLVSARTALICEIKGLLLEYGIVTNRSSLRNQLPVLMSEQSENRSYLWISTFKDLYEELCELEVRITQHTKRLKEFASGSDDIKRLLAIPGVGIIIATAIVAAVGNVAVFSNGRQFAAWLGLTPRQNTTGGKPKLGGISKRGDKYIRKLLVQGACSLSIAVKRKVITGKKLNKTEKWFYDLLLRKGHQKATVAMANKMARMIWVVLSGKEFKTQEELYNSLPLAA